MITLMRGLEPLFSSELDMFLCFLFCAYFASLYSATCSAVTLYARFAVCVLVIYFGVIRILFCKFVSVFTVCLLHLLNHYAVTSCVIFCWSNQLQTIWIYARGDFT